MAANCEQAFKDTMEFVERVVKANMLEELQDHDWEEQMRLKCRAYIKNNGTKTISVDEIIDFLEEDAFKTFPLIVRDKCEDSLKEIIESLLC